MKNTVNNGIFFISTGAECLNHQGYIGTREVLMSLLLPGDYMTPFKDNDTTPCRTTLNR